MMLNQCFDEAVKRKIISENPMGDLKKPKSRKKTEAVRAMTVDEQKKFIAALEQENSQYGDQFLISIFTGMRMGEVNALTINDINTNFNFINVDKTIAKGPHGEPFVNQSPKTDSGNRQIPINELVKPVIDRVLAKYVPTPDGQLFHTSVGTLIGTQVSNTEFNRIMKKYNIREEGIKGKITQHSLRHTYATRCIEGGMPPKVLQTLMGHANIKVTLDTYADVFNKFQSETIKQVDDYLKNMGLTISA